MALRFAPTRGAGAVTLNALIRGPQGVAATVAAGTATTGAAGSSAAVANSGSSGAAVFDFTIPRGADAGMRYAFEASTVMAAPASGGVRKNNATLSLVTAFAVNATNSDGSDVSDFIATWDDSTNSTKGSLVVRKEGSGAVLGVFAITSIVDNTTWLQINVTYVSGSGTLTAADPVYLTANLTGDKGTNGTVAIGGTPSANQIATWSNSTTIQGVSITGLVKGNGASAPAAAVQGADYWAPGGTDVAIADGGTNASTAYGAFDNLSIHGADIASATTTNLETATGNLADVTGTTAITAITLSEGHRRTVRFTGILTLTNGASLVLPGAANITTAAGDFAEFRGYAAGVVRCTEYMRADGTPLALGAGTVTFAKIASAAIATAAQWLANTASLLLTTDKVWTAAQKVTITDASSVTPDFSAGINFIWTIGATGRTIVNPTSPKEGQTGVIYLVQDGTGSRTITSWGSQYKFSGGTKPTLSTAANAIDVLSYHCKSTTEIECFFTAGMA